MSSSRPISPLPYTPVEGVSEPVTAEAFESLAEKNQDNPNFILESMQQVARLSKYLALSARVLDKWEKKLDTLHDKLTKPKRGRNSEGTHEDKEGKEEVSAVREATEPTSKSRASKRSRTRTTTAATLTSRTSTTTAATLTSSRAPSSMGSSSSSSSSVRRRALPPVPRVPFPPVPEAPIPRVEPALVFMPDTAPGSLLAGILPLPALPEAPDAHPIPVGTPTLISVPDTSPQPVSRTETTPDVSSISSGSSTSSALVAFSSYPQSSYPMSSPGSATPSEHKAFPADLASTLVVQDILARWSAIQGLPSSIGVFGGSAPTSSASTAQLPHGSSSSLSSLLVRRPGETS